MRKKAIRAAALLLICALLALQGFAAPPRMLVPVGEAVGLRLYAQGIVIVGFDEDGSSPAEQAGLQKGDVIRQIDGRPIDSLDSLAAALRDGGSVNLTVEREGKCRQFTVQPRNTDDGYRLGAYVRDSISGIGTITYYDPASGAFGALGHGVSDTQTRTLMPVEHGCVVPAEVTDVQKGVSGTPGSLKGSFRPEEPTGTIERNTASGIFGHLTQAPAGKACSIATPEQVHTGEATILSNVEGDRIEEYSIRISQVDLGQSADGRNMLITVTDPELLEKTGGIVQGMGVRYNRDNTGKP